MKKLIGIVFVAIFLSGCDAGLPTTDDVNNVGWELWVDGIVENKEVDINGSSRTFYLTFRGGEKLKVLKFSNWDEFEEGDAGTVYKWRTNIGADEYIWEPKGGKIPKSPSITEVVTIVKEVEPVKIDATTRPTTPAKYKWHDAKYQQPEPQQIVVIEFEDGFLSMGYYTRQKEWKLDIMKRKMSGGTALSDVARWKLVNLE